ncbi:PadR family transcriptional regulator [Dactylosporangium sp. CA-233914]|uniref:PadR family transcriptional regulator n=1 Tax=Dactylosporangium sp. CA-233914 TaxID=3239934 RepID=UPI003D900069
MTSMREPTFLILTALAVRALHGYAVIREVERLSDGRVVIPAGTLYAALDRLTGEGLVEPERSEVVEGRHRRYYRLTDGGAAALAADADRQRRNAAAAAKRLRLRAAGPR